MGGEINLRVNSKEECDPNEIKPDIANKVFCAMKDAVAGRGIELLAIPKQMKIEENHAE